MKPDAEYCWEWPDAYDFFETTRLLRTGRHDPTVRREPDGLWRSARLLSGPVTVRLLVEPGKQIRALVWGPGAQHAKETIPHWIGLREPKWELPSHPKTDPLLASNPGIRLNNTRDVFEACVNIALQQRLTWNEAAYHWRRLIEEIGDAAPGPKQLLVFPAAAAVRQISLEHLASLGIEPRRAHILKELAFAASHLNRVHELDTLQAYKFLKQIPGVGDWTASMTLGLRLGRPDIIVTGDVHLPHTVCWALAREPRGSDTRMIELLKPFGDQAFRVIRLIFAARIRAPRRGPRRATQFGPIS